MKNSDLLTTADEKFKAELKNLEKQQANAIKRLAASGSHAVKDAQSAIESDMQTVQTSLRRLRRAVGLLWLSVLAPLLIVGPLYWWLGNEINEKGHSLWQTRNVEIYREGRQSYLLIPGGSAMTPNTLEDGRRAIALP